MRARNPDQRYRAVVAATVPPEEVQVQDNLALAVRPENEHEEVALAPLPEHIYDRKMWDALQGISSDAHIVWALEIYNSMYEREILQAWLLARAGDADIEKWLRVPPDVTRIYRHLFFNVDAFRDELDLLSWVNEYEAEKKGTPYGAQLLRDAVQGGLEKLCWIFGHNMFVIDPELVKQRAMTDMYIRSLAGRGHGITSKEARAALDFSNSALRAAQIVGRTSIPDAQAFLLKLRYREMTEAVTATALTDEILH